MYFIAQTEKIIRIFIVVHNSHKKYVQLNNLKIMKQKLQFIENITIPKNKILQIGTFLPKTE